MKYAIIKKPLINFAKVAYIGIFENITAINEQVHNIKNIMHKLLINEFDEYKVIYIQLVQI